MVRIVIAFTLVALLNFMPTSSDASPLLTERSLKTCGGGSIEHVVGESDEIGAYLVYIKEVASTPLTEKQRVLSDVEMKSLGLVDDEIESGSHKIIVAEKCGGTKNCSGKTCQGAKASCVEGTRGCFCQDK